MFIHVYTWFPVEGMKYVQEKECGKVLLFKYTSSNESVITHCSMRKCEWILQSVLTGQKRDHVLPLNVINSSVGKYASYLKKIVSDWHIKGR